MLKMLERKVTFIFITTIFVIAFLVLALFYSQESEAVYIVAAALLALVWTLYFLFYAYMIWFRFIEAQLKQYREENNLASGVIVWLSFFSYLIFAPGLFLLVMGNGAPNIVRNGYPTYLQIIIAIMPAILGLLGVQYTIAIQAKNRKEDIRLAKKPFFTIEYKIGGVIRKEDSSPHAFFLHFQITNISENIAIPIGFGGGETDELSFWFDYSPIPGAGVVKSVAVVDANVPLTSDMYTLKFYYKDILDHYYCTHICIRLSNTLKYKTPIVSSEFLCTPEIVEWLKKTAFSKSSDYWETYEKTT